MILVFFDQNESRVSSVRNEKANSTHIVMNFNYTYFIFKKFVFEVVNVCKIVDGNRYDLAGDCL